LAVNIRAQAITVALLTRARQKFVPAAIAVTFVSPAGIGALVCPHSRPFHFSGEPDFVARLCNGNNIVAVGWHSSFVQNHFKPHATIVPSVLSEVVTRTGGDGNRIIQRRAVHNGNKICSVQYEPQFVTLPLSSATTPCAVPAASEMTLVKKGRV